MPTYSVSRLRLFEQCPRRYFYCHVARLPGEPSAQHPATFMGSRVHEALEYLYARLKDREAPTADELAAWYRQRWVDQWAIDPPLVQAWDSPERWERIGEACLIGYHAQHHPFDADETIALEHFVEFPLDTDGTIRFQGFIDRVARVHDGTIRVHDYKTQESVPDQAEIDADEQLAFYELAIRHDLNHSGSVELVWHFVRAGVVLTSTRTSEQLNRIRDAAIHLIRRIETLADREDRFEPRPSPLCRWCEYRKLCPAGDAEGVLP